MCVYFRICSISCTSEHIFLLWLSWYPSCVGLSICDLLLPRDTCFFGHFWEILCRQRWKVQIRKVSTCIIYQKTTQCSNSCLNCIIVLCSNFHCHYFIVLYSYFHDIIVMYSYSHKLLYYYCHLAILSLHVVHCRDFKYGRFYNSNMRVYPMLITLAFPSNSVSRPLLFCLYWAVLCVLEFYWSTNVLSCIPPAFCVLCIWILITFSFIL